MKRSVFAISNIVYTPSDYIADKQKKRSLTIEWKSFSQEVRSIAMENRDVTMPPRPLPYVASSARTGPLYNLQYIRHVPSTECAIFPHEAGQFDGEEQRRRTSHRPTFRVFVTVVLTI